MSIYIFMSIYMFVVSIDFRLVDEYIYVYNLLLNNGIPGYVVI